MLATISNFIQPVDGGLSGSYGLLFGISVFVNVFFMVLLVKGKG